MQKIILLLLLSINLLFASQTLKERYPHLPSSMIEYHEQALKTLPSIEKMYTSFDTLSVDEKKELKVKVKALFPYTLIKESQKLDRVQLTEFYNLYLWLMNYKAYVLIDKYYDDPDFIQAMVMAALAHKLVSSSVSYEDTYLWALVRSKEYTLPLKRYPELLKHSKDEEMQKHYEYAFKKAKEKE